MSWRHRLAMAIGVLVILMLGGGFWLIEHSIERRIELEFDAALRHRLEDIASTINMQPTKVKIPRRSADLLMVVIVTPEGATLLGTPIFPRPTDLILGQARFSTGIASTGEQCRTVWMRVIPQRGEPTVFRPIDLGIAVSMAEFERSVTFIRQTMAGWVTLIALGLLAVLWLAFGYILAPHAWLAKEVDRLDPQVPGRRLQVDHLPSELRGIAERVNDFVARLERAYGLASNFHSAAAHELRTPLAGMRATIEVAQESNGDPREALATCHEITLQMQSRINNLLMATRMDAGRKIVQRDEVDLHHLLQVGWGKVQARAAARGLTIEWRLEGNGLCLADPEGMRMVVTNLLDNVVSHAGNDMPVVIACRDQEQRLIFSVSNSAPRMDGARLTHLLERKWRIGSESAEWRHGGLGMSIVGELVNLMEGEIDLTAQEGRFHVEVKILTPDGYSYW